MNSDLAAAPILSPKNSYRTALLDISIDVFFNDLLSHTTIKQSYRNIENKPIEAVFTFPLPLDAVLLDMKIHMNGRMLQGVVKGKTDSENTYNDAVFEGDMAVMMEMIEPGLYVINVGNIDTGGMVDIEFTYSELYKFKDDIVRFTLPVTIAPRYSGNGGNGRIFEPHQIPEYDFLREVNYRVMLTVTGLLADAEFTSPTHMLSMERKNGKTLVHLPKNETKMDRDLVINIHMKSENINYALIDKDINGYSAVFSVSPIFQAKNAQSRSIILVLDSSASMTGDAIHQSRMAFENILDILKSRDYFNVVRFGQETEALFPNPVKATPSHIEKAREMLPQFQSDMGGTEISVAIDRILKMAAPKNLQNDIILITDGEIWNWEEITEKLNRGPSRFFTVGVGSAPAENFLKRLAEVTGGVYEPVSPRESISERILATVKRIFQPRAKKIEIQWPTLPSKILSPVPQSVYSGETIVQFVRFLKKPKGRVTFYAELEDGGEIITHADLHDFIQITKDADGVNFPGYLSRIAAAVELRSLSDAKKASVISENYQVMSLYANYILIDKRDDKNKLKDVPELRKTPHMFTAGWAGLGTVGEDLHSYTFSRESLEGVNQETAAESPSFADNEILIFISRVCDYINHNDIHDLTISALFELGLPHDVRDKLSSMVESGLDEYAVVILFLHTLIDIRMKNVPNIDHSVITERELESLNNGIDEMDHLRMMAIVKQ